jgi:hypothetical protein
VRFTPPPHVSLLMQNLVRGGDVVPSGVEAGGPRLRQEAVIARRPRVGVAHCRADLVKLRTALVLLRLRLFVSTAEECRATGLRVLDFIQRNVGPLRSSKSSIWDKGFDLESHATGRIRHFGVGQRQPSPAALCCGSLSRRPARARGPCPLRTRTVASERFGGHVHGPTEVRGEAGRRRRRGRRRRTGPVGKGGASGRRRRPGRRQEAVEGDGRGGAQRRP